MAIRRYGIPSWRRSIGLPPCPHRRIRACLSVSFRSRSARLIESERNGQDPRDMTSTPHPRSLRRRLVPLLAALLAAGTAHAQLKIEVTSGVTDPVPIAIVPFARAVPADGGLDVAQVVQHDLEGSGRFKALPRDKMPATPTTADAVQLADWKALGDDYVVVGRLASVDSGSISVDFDLLNTLTGQHVASQRFVGSPTSLRNGGHRPGAFAGVSAGGRRCGRREPAARSAVTLPADVPLVVSGWAMAGLRLV